MLHEGGLIVGPDAVDQAPGGGAEQLRHRPMDEEVDVPVRPGRADRAEQREEEDPVPDALVEPKDEDLANL
jgi:hypothetical protein